MGSLNLLYFQHIYDPPKHWVDAGTGGGPELLLSSKAVGSAKEIIISPHVGKSTFFHMDAFSTEMVEGEALNLHFWRKGVHDRKNVRISHQ